MKKCYTEVSYALGLIGLALATALMTKGDFGVSMVVAPAYLCHLKLQQALPFFTFGTAEYTLQAVLLVALMLVMRRFRWSYLFSFVTAVLYGLLLDGALALVELLPLEYLWVRLICYATGMVLCSLSVALLFHTYIAPEAYELFVKELAGKLNREISWVKTAYDCVSCLISVTLSFAFFGFGHFVGIGLGTVVTALVNGPMIGFFNRQLEKRLVFADGLPLRKWFEK